MAVMMEVEWKNQGHFCTLLQEGEEIAFSSFLKTGIHTFSFSVKGHIVNILCFAGPMWALLHVLLLLILSLLLLLLFLLLLLVFQTVNTVSNLQAVQNWAAGQI